MENELWGIGRTWIGWFIVTILVFVLTLTGHITAEVFMSTAVELFLIVAGIKGGVAVSNVIGTAIAKKKEG